MKPLFFVTAILNLGLFASAPANAEWTIKPECKVRSEAFKAAYQDNMQWIRQENAKILPFYQRIRSQDQQIREKLKSLNVSAEIKKMEDESPGDYKTVRYLKALILQIEKVNNTKPTVLHINTKTLIVDARPGILEFDLTSDHYPNKNYNLKSNLVPKTTLPTFAEFLRDNEMLNDHCFDFNLAGVKELPKAEVEKMMREQDEISKNLQARIEMVSKLQNNACDEFRLNRAYLQHALRVERAINDQSFDRNYNVQSAMDFLKQLDADNKVRIEFLKNYHHFKDAKEARAFLTEDKSGLGPFSMYYCNVNKKEDVRDCLEREFKTTSDSFEMRIKSNQEGFDKYRSELNRKLHELASRLEEIRMELTKAKDIACSEPELKDEAQEVQSYLKLIEERKQKSKAQDVKENSASIVK